jgi:valyl-tRNA synthetase
LGSCGTGNLSRETIRTVKDSTVTEVTYHKRDTVITIPGDTTRISVPFTEITNEPIRKTTGRTTAIISRDGDNVNVECITEELQQKLDLIDKVIKQLRTIQESEKTTIEVPVKFVPWTTKILAWIGGIALGAIAVLLGIKFLKP